jgi:hypothetical protein
LFVNIDVFPKTMAVRLDRQLGHEDHSLRPDGQQADQPLEIGLIDVTAHRLVLAPAADALLVAIASDIPGSARRAFSAQTTAQARVVVSLCHSLAMRAEGDPGQGIGVGILLDAIIRGAAVGSLVANLRDGAQQLDREN